MPASSLSFESPVAFGALVALVAALALAWLLARWLIGPPANISRNGLLYGLRGVAFVLLAAILLNPVRVREAPGVVERPELFYLLDSSQSMTLGDPTTRWDEALRVMQEAAVASRDQHLDVKLFRFGQRLQASDDFDGIYLPRIGAAAPADDPPTTSLLPRAIAADAKTAAMPTKVKVPLAPTDSDTQLVTALRQISSRFGHKPPAGIVLFSDGRARDETGVEQIASQFARLNVPVHVVPTGNLGKRGDISIVAAVVPPRVRKFTEVEVQVFIRSFGFDGHRTEVKLSVPDAPGKPGRELASIPVTLVSGFQAATVSFRSTLESHKVAIHIPPVEGEISDANNGLTSEIAIDRTKIRVLYIEGSSQSLTISRQGDRNVVRGAHSDLALALTGDDDIECVVIGSSLGGSRLARITEQGLDTSRGFPETKAELAAFDAIILSDIPERAFVDKQLEWIQEWVGQRGGGLLMVGGPRSFGSGGWEGTKIAEMLPVDFLNGPDWNSGERLSWRPILTNPPHPVWMLFTDQSRNLNAFRSLPGFTGAQRFAAVKPNLTNVLADGMVTNAGAVPQKPAPVKPPADSLQSLFRNLVTGETPSVDLSPERQSDGRGAAAAVVTGRYGRGRTMAMSTAVTAPWASDFTTQWKQGDQNNHARFWRNVVYWLTESSSIGRRRLVAGADKRFYNPGDTLSIASTAFNELARQTKDYRIVMMVEPNASLKDTLTEYSPLRWPEGLTRTSGEEGPFIAWGEEIEIPLADDGEKPHYGLKLPIADALSTGAASQSLRLELTAYEDLTQVDSTSLDVQILHDPFELQNPFPNHDLLKKIASLSLGQVLNGPHELSAVIQKLPVKLGPPIISRTPLWSTWWLWTTLMTLLTIEWLWRRKIGLA